MRTFRRLQAQKVTQQQESLSEHETQPSSSPELRLAKRMKVLKKYDIQVRKLVELQREDYETMLDEERQLIRTHVRLYVSTYTLSTHRERDTKRYNERVAQQARCFSEKKRGRP